MVNKLDIEIPHQVEGPILQRNVEMNLKDWKSRLDPRTTDDKSIPFDRNVEKLNPFRQKLVELIKSQLGEKEKDDPILGVLTDPNNNDYVFRCFSRSTDATDYRNSEDPSDNIHKYGYDKPPEEDDMFWYGINHAWLSKLWPLYDTESASYILIYKNDPDVFRQDSKAIELRSRKQEAPSLRDLLIGVVKIDWK